MFSLNRFSRNLPVVLACFFSCENEDTKTADPTVETISINLLGDSMGDWNRYPEFPASGRDLARRAKFFIFAIA